MRKIPTLYKRDGDRVIPEITPGCEWVFTDEAVATQKFDGTACKIEGGRLYKRREVKDGQSLPADFVQAGIANGKRQGWVPVEETDKWHLQAFRSEQNWTDGTYELIGPKIQGNPEKWMHHILIPHGRVELNVSPEWGPLQEFLKGRNMEGIVWWGHGRMAKIKKKDFGLSR